MLKTTLASLEATRMALCALSYGGELLANRVHFHRVSHLARRVHPEGDALADLNEMSILGEAANLEGGYWLPVCPTTVAVGEWTLLLAPHPQRELERALGVEIHALGLVRGTMHGPPVDWPSRTLAQWTRIPEDTRQWTMSQLLRHRSALVPTRYEGGQLEFYRATPWRRGMQPRRWLALEQALDVVEPGALLLLRELEGGHARRHFMGLHKDGQLTDEVPLECDLLRMQFGLELLAGGAKPLTVSANANYLHIRLTRALPAEERTLLIALCLIQQSDDSVQVRVPVAFADVCLNQFEKLGFEPQRQQ